MKINKVSLFWIIVCIILLGYLGDDEFVVRAGLLATLLFSIENKDEESS